MPDPRNYISAKELTSLAGPDPFGGDLEVISLARALDALGLHAAMMDNADEDHHDACLECSTMQLLARVVGFGNQLRAVEKRIRS